MAPSNRVQIYKKHTSNIVDFLYDNCEQILGRTQWNTTIGPLPEGSTYKLPVRVFVRSAEIIANAKKLPIPITYGVLADVKDAIRLRMSESSTGRVLALQGGKLRMIFETHLHFIDILRKVQRLLEARASQNDHRTLYTGDQYEQEKVPEPTRNSALFELLANDDDEEEVDEQEKPDQLNAAFGASVQQGEAEITVDNLDSNSSVEFYFLLNCYLVDVEEIRHHCGMVWEQFAKHEVTLTTASNTTNVAYGLLKTRTAQFVLESEGLDSGLAAHQAVMTGQAGPLWYLRQVWRSKHPGVVRSISNATFKSMSPKVYNFADSLWMPCADLFLSFWLHNGAMEQWDLEILRDTSGPPAFSQSSRTKDRAVLAQRFQQKAWVAGFLLREFIRLSKFQLYNKQIPQAPVDELTYELAFSLQSDRVSEWGALGMQILVDIHGILAQDVNRPWAECDALKSWVRKDVEDHPTQEPDWVFKGLTEKIDLFDQDIISVQAAAYRKRSRKKAKQKAKEGSEDQALGTSPPPFLLSRNNPVLAGYQTFKILSTAQALSTSIANKSSAVHMTIHMYNALRQRDSTMPAWDDAEFLIAHHGVTSMFAGSRPRSMEEAEKRLRSMLRNRKLGLNLEFKISPLQGILVKLNSEDDFNTDFRDLQKFLVEQLKKEESQADRLEDGRTSSREATQYDKATGGRKGASAGAARPRKRNAENYQKGTDVYDQPTPRRILTKVTKLLHEEELHGYFDYFTMHEHCKRLMEHMAVIFHLHAPVGEKNRRTGEMRVLMTCFDLLGACAKDPETEANKARLSALEHLFRSMIMARGRVEVNAVERLSGVKYAPVESTVADAETSSSFAR